MPRSPVAFDWRPAAWLVADAGLAALFAGPIEALLLFLVSPDRPLTARDFLATLVALAPQIVAVFVLLGPALVLAGVALSVGRTTARGLSARYVLRFALLDAVLLAIAVITQWRSLGPLVPEPGRTALGLTTSTLVAAALLLGVLALRDAWRPMRALVPWIAAIGLGTAVALAIAGELRRTRFTTPRPIELPGFALSRGALVVELPGLEPGDLDRALERGEVPALADLAARGFRAPVDGAPADDTLAAHAGLVTGRGPEHHGILDSVRYRPRGDRRSFAVLPRGLFLRPLVRTPLWRRIPVDHRSLRCVALPGIADALGLTGPQRGGGAAEPPPALALVADPLGWPDGAGRYVVPLERLGPGLRVPLPAGADEASCPDPGDVGERFFDPPAESLADAARWAGAVRNALARDRCAAELGTAALAAGHGLVHVRLDGHREIVERFAGYERRRPARGVAENEMDAYGKVRPRYLREIDPLLARLVAQAGPERLVVVVSPHGVAAREDLARLLAQVIGLREPTGSLDGSPPGVVFVAGPGVREGARSGRAIRLGSILPTLLWALDLPVASDMGVLSDEPFERDFVAARPVVTVPSYTRTVRGAPRP